ncbi:MAG: hypothetical protein DI613_16490 [Kocuria rhizophila]|nr:MAG: hypothetical protein DI613_16490 [Kocuria rhizophila]
MRSWRSADIRWGIQEVVAPTDGDLSDAAWALLARLMGGLPPGTVVRRESRGRPRLEPEHAHVSVSHHRADRSAREGVVAAAVSTRGPVGVDVLHLRPMSPPLREVLADLWGRPAVEVMRWTDQQCAMAWALAEADAKRSGEGIWDRWRRAVAEDGGVQADWAAVLHVSTGTVALGLASDHTRGGG